MRFRLLAIFADVHANDAALGAVLAAAQALGATEFVSLGDVAGYHCGLDECVAMLHDRRAVNLLGNHDSYFLGLSFPTRSETARAAIEYQRAAASPATVAWIAASVAGIDDGVLSMVHGGWRDSTDEYLYRLEPHYFQSLPERLLFSGHTHVQGIWTVGGRTYCNPGSVGQPRDGDPRTAFATWDGKRVRLHRVGYDIESFCERMSKAGFPERAFRNLRSGTRVGGGVSTVVVAGTKLYQPDDG